MIVFTGSQHSATTYIGTLMQSVGVDIGLECIGRDGIVAWQIAGQCDFVPFEPGTISEKKFRRKKKFNLYYQEIIDQASIVFHQTRDPLKVISSVFSGIKKKPWTWIFVGKALPEIAKIPLIEEEKLKLAAEYWYYWNLKAEQISDYRYRVEDIDEEFPIIGEKIGKEFNSEMLQGIPRNVNSSHKSQEYRLITWEDLKEVSSELLFDDMRGLAEKYRYRYE